MNVEDRFRWMTNHTGNGFGAIREADDLLHPDGNPAAASVTETYYFGFHVAEHALHGTIYIWFHPNLGVVTAGTLISCGVKPCSLAADYFNMQAYLRIDEHVDRTTGSMCFPGGLRLTPMSPMSEWHLSLQDPTSDTSFDLRFSAAMPPAVRADQKHFDQNMHVVGELSLRGQPYAVDCHAIRDRSWQNARPEDPMPVPPYDWICVTRAAEFAMNLSLFDDMALLGDVPTALSKPTNLLQDAWVYRDKALFRIIDVKKTTERSVETLRPLNHRIQATDEAGQVYELSGQTIASCNWNGWPNMLWQQCLTQWTCNGMPGVGEVQEVQWHDFIRLLRPAA